VDRDELQADEEEAEADVRGHDAECREPAEASFRAKRREPEKTTDVPATSTRRGRSRAGIRVSRPRSPPWRRSSR